MRNLEHSPSLVKRLAAIAGAFAVGAVALVAGAASPPPLSPALKRAQVPYAGLANAHRWILGKTADWVIIDRDAVWVGPTGPDAVHRLDPRTNREVAVVALPGEACAGLALGFGSLWVPLCAKPNALARIDLKTNRLTTVLPIGPAAAEGGITTGGDSVWMITDAAGTLARIDSATGQVRQRIAVPPGSFNPRYSDGVVWVTGNAANLVTAVDARSGKVLGGVPIGPQPRFLTAGAGSIWTLNQGDGTVTRIDAHTRKVTATIPVGTPGHGGDIGYGAGTVWTTFSGVPLTAIDVRSDRVRRQWVGPGGDSLAYGFGAVWLTDYDHGTVVRIPLAAMRGNPAPTL
jgi:virginiamycin B lyase